MMTVSATAYVHLDGRKVKAHELLADAGLRARANVRGNPSGGVEISSGVDSVCIDDITNFVCDEVLLQGAALLRAGRPIIYRSALSRDGIAITISEGMAVLDDGAGGHVEAPVEKFAAALDAGAEEYRALLAACS